MIPSANREHRRAVILHYHHRRHASPLKSPSEPGRRTSVETKLWSAKSALLADNHTSQHPGSESSVWSLSTGISAGDKRSHLWRAVCWVRLSGFQTANKSVLLPSELTPNTHVANNSTWTTNRWGHNIIFIWIRFGTHPNVLVHPG